MRLGRLKLLSIPLLLLGLFLLLGKVGAQGNNIRYFFNDSSIGRGDSGICIGSERVCNGGDPDDDELGSTYFHFRGSPGPNQTEYVNGRTGDQVIITVDNCDPSQGTIEGDDFIEDGPITIQGDPSILLPGDEVGECVEDPGGGGGGGGGTCQNPPQEAAGTKIVRTTITLRTNFAGEVTNFIVPMAIELRSGDNPDQIIQTIQTAQQEVNSNVLTWETDFTNVNGPCNYRVCVPVLDQCQDVTKQPGAILTVRFNEVDAPPEVYGDNQDGENCEFTGGTEGWFYCPILRMVTGALNFLDSRIQEMLDIANDYYVNDGFVRAWGNIRNLAYLILVPITLVMVIGTALGFDFMSAYTVKRALPRLGLAVVGIALSYDLCVFGIVLINDVGAGVLGLIQTPFNIPTDYGLGTLLGDAELGFVFTAGILLLLFFYFVPILLGVLVGFIVLLLRQMVIVGLVLAAPLALLAWIFPGNDKLWKLWWSTFTKLLMMYPIIMALIGLGRVFSYLIHTTETGISTIPVVSPALAFFGQGLGGVAEQELLVPLMAVTAYVVPYGTIPLTWQGAVILGTVAGFVGGKAGGWFNGVRDIRRAGKHNRKEERKKEKAQLREQQRLQGRNRPGVFRWRAGRDYISQVRSLRQTGQLKWGGLGLVTKSGRDQLKQERFGLIRQGADEARKSDAGYVAGDTAGNYASSMARNKKEWKQLYKDQMKRLGHVVSEDQTETQYAAHARSYGAEAGSATLRRAALQNYLADATNANTGKKFTDDARVKMMNEKLAPVMRALDDGVIEDLAAANNMWREVGAKRVDQAGGEWMDSYDFLGHSFDRYRRGEASTVELGSEDPDEAGAGTLRGFHQRVITKSQKGELAGSNYRAKYSVAPQMVHSVRHAQRKMSEAAQRGDQADADKWATIRDARLGDYMGLAEASMQLDPESKEIFREGLHNETVDEKGTTVWQAAREAEMSGSTPYRQSIMRYGTPQGDGESARVPAGVGTGGGDEHYGDPRGYV